MLKSDGIHATDETMRELIVLYENGDHEGFCAGVRHYFQFELTDVEDVEQNIRDCYDDFKQKIAELDATATQSTDPAQSYPVMLGAVFLRIGAEGESI